MSSLPLVLLAPSEAPYLHVLPLAIPLVPSPVLSLVTLTADQHVQWLLVHLLVLVLPLPLPLSLDKHEGALPSVHWSLTGPSAQTLVGELLLHSGSAP